MKFALLLIVLTGTVCTAQFVPVVALSSADVAKVERVHQAMLDAEKAWSDLHGEITNHYLIVDKDDPEASMEKWYPEDHSASVLVTMGAWHIFNNNADSMDECSPKYKQTRDKMRAEQDQREQEREAKSRRYRKGWVKSQNCDGCGVKDFEYSEDWKYLIPKSTPTVVQPQSPWIINGTTSSPATLQSSTQ